jgi:hypothetical protein
LIESPLSFNSNRPSSLSRTPQKIITQTLLRFARFELKSLQNDPELYIAVLEWQPHQRLKEAIYLRGAVSKGA